jgi:hypothetical protein
VSDFGLSGKKGNQKGTGIFPIKWTAPEAMKSQEFTVESDVYEKPLLLLLLLLLCFFVHFIPFSSLSYSFGITLYETFSTDGEDPYMDEDYEQLSDKVEIISFLQSHVKTVKLIRIFFFVTTRSLLACDR